MGALLERHLATARAHDLLHRRHERHHRPSGRLRTGPHHDRRRPRRNDDDAVVLHLHQGVPGISDGLRQRHRLAPVRDDLRDHTGQLALREPRMERVMNAKRSSDLLLAHTLLIVIALLMMLPFLWMLLASFKILTDIESANPIPATWHPENYRDVFRMGRTTGE